jgi:hypothetical protein
VSEGQKPTVPNAEPGDDPNLSKPIYNWLSIFGGVTAVGSLTSVVFFFLLGLVSEGGAGYSGLALLPPLGVKLQIQPDILSA